MIKRIARISKDLIEVGKYVFSAGFVCRFVLAHPYVLKIDGNMFYFKTIGLSLIWGGVIVALLSALGLFFAKKNDRKAWLGIIPLAGVASIVLAEVSYFYNGNYLSTTDFLPYLLGGEGSVTDIGSPVMQYAPFIIGAGIIAFALWYEGRE